MSKRLNWKDIGDPLTREWSDPDKAKALRELIIQHINREIQKGEGFGKWVEETAAAKGMKAGQFKKWLKTNDYSAYRLLKDQGYEARTLRRGLAEYLTTDADFFEQKGVLQVLTAADDAPLWKKLGSFDSNFSGFKDSTGKVGHHTTLSSLTDMLSSVSKDWREKYLAIAKAKGYKLGDRGLLDLDPIAHKPFSTVKGDPTTWSVKGILKDKLLPLMPDAKVVDGKLHIKKGVNPKLDELINGLQSISSHGNWARNTRGFNIEKELAQLSPEKAFEVSRNILDIEVEIGRQGKSIDNLLETTFKKGNFSNLDEAIDSLSHAIKQKHRQPGNIEGLFKNYETMRDSALADLNFAKKGGANQTVLGVQKAGTNGLLSSAANSRLAKYGAKFTKVATGAGKAETALNLASGNYVAGGIGVAVQTPAFQKQVAKLLAKQGLKMIPGVSIGSGIMQAVGYGLSGQYGKAALSVGGGVVGELGPAGDAVQAMIDLGLTADDIRLEKAAKAKQPDTDIDMSEGGKVRKYETGVIHSATGQGDQAFDNVVNALKEDPTRFDKSGFSPRIDIEDLTKQLSKFDL